MIATCRALNAMIQLETFTSDELASAAGLPKPTAAKVVARHRDLLTREDPVSRGSVGRPCHRYRPTPEGREKIIAKLRRVLEAAGATVEELPPATLTSAEDLLLSPLDGLSDSDFADAMLGAESLIASAEREAVIVPSPVSTRHMRLAKELLSLARAERGGMTTETWTHLRRLQGILDQFEPEPVLQQEVKDRLTRGQAVLESVVEVSEPDSSLVPIISAVGADPVALRRSLVSAIGEHESVIQVDRPHPVYAASGQFRTAEGLKLEELLFSGYVSAMLPAGIVELPAIGKEANDTGWPRVTLLASITEETADQDARLLQLAQIASANVGLVLVAAHALPSIVARLLDRQAGMILKVDERQVGGAFADAVARLMKRAEPRM